MTAPVLTPEEFVAAQGRADARRSPAKLVGKIADLIERAGIPIEEIGAVSRVSLYQESDAGIGGWIRFDPRWALGPEWPVVQPAKPCVVNAPKPVARKRRGTQTAVVLPDTQIGFRYLRDGLDPFHDDAALSVAVRVISELQPSLVIHVGDFIDFPAHSRYVQEPAFAATTQAALDRAHRFLAEIRAAAPGARIVVLEGNHDLRLHRSIMVNAAASFGLQRANLPESWPVQSVPHLCRFDELGVEYQPGYPANELWINDNLRVVHGLKVKSNGSTAAAVVEDERVSTIFGHIHRIELQHRTRHTKAGPKQLLAASPGCLCRIDGAVPSVKGGIDLLGRPLVSYENWQQGVGVVSFEPGDGAFSVELVPIHQGRAYLRGQPIEGKK